MPVLRVFQQSAICVSLRCNNFCSTVNFSSSSCRWQIHYYITSIVCKNKWREHIGSTLGCIINTSGCVINHAQDDRMVHGNWRKSINLLLVLNDVLNANFGKFSVLFPDEKSTEKVLWEEQELRLLPCVASFTHLLSQVNPLAPSQPPMCTGPTDAISICCNYRRPHSLLTLSKHIHMQNTLPTGVIHAA